MYYIDSQKATPPAIRPKNDHITAYEDVFEET